MTQPKTASKFTPGKRAAEVIDNVQHREEGFLSPKKMAQIINRETKAPEMYELLKHMSIHKHLCKHCPDEARRIKAEIDGVE